MTTLRPVRSVYWVCDKVKNLTNNLYAFQNASKKAFHSSGPLFVEGLPLKMPALSPTMTDGTILKWLKKEGESIEPGDLICDIQTDKAVVGYEVDEEGTLAKILVPEDTKDIPIGTLIALMVGEGVDWKDVEMPKLDDDSTTNSSEASTQAVSGATLSKDDNFGPSVRLLLQKFGLHPECVPPGGPHGKLLKGDVLHYVRANNIQPQPAKQVKPPSIASSAPTPAASAAPAPSAKVIVGDGYDDIELTSMRKTIAKRLSQSKSSIAHTYSTMECRIDAVLKLRKDAKKNGVAFSVNDAIIKASAVALSQCPQINAVWEGNQLVQKSEIDISVAVATPAGLITPIVKGADAMGLEEISLKIKDLATRARDNKLKLNEFQGGTFTISNLGMFGIREFSAIINQPQCAILAVGGGIVGLDEFGLPETRMRATLSYDQAAISDDVAADFMNTLKEVLQEPQNMLLGSIPRIDHPLASLI